MSEESAVMAELQDLEQIYKKTAQAFRIRLKLHSAREQAMVNIGQKMQAAASRLKGEEHKRAIEQILAQGTDIDALRNVFRQEVRVFKFVGQEAKTADQIVENAMSNLRQKEKLITSLGWPSAAARLMRRPSAPRNSFFPDLRVYSSRNGLILRTPLDMALRPRRSISMSK